MELLLVFKLIPYDGLSPPTWDTVNRPAALFYVHRQSGFGIKPDTVNPLDGIVSVLVGALSLSLCNSFCQYYRGLSRFVCGSGAISFHRLLSEYASKYCTKEPSS